MIYHTKEITKENIFLKHGRGSRLCQKTEDAVDSDLAMIVAGLLSLFYYFAAVAVVIEEDVANPS